MPGNEREVRFGPTTFDEAAVSSYLTAVDDEAMARLNAGSDEKWVPPLAMAAQFSTMVDHLQLPLEALHIAQEMEFLEPVPVGSSVSCLARISTSRERKEGSLMFLEFETVNSSGKTVLRGKATILLPGRTG